ncbi:MAG: ABC transporter permease [Promethearchaeota archaeon]
MKLIGSYKIDSKWQDLLKNIIFSFLIAILVLFIGLTINFILVYNLPGDPVLGYLPLSYTQEQYDATEHMLGFDRPMIVQYFRFLSNLFSGKWGISSSINRGESVIDLLSERIPRNTTLLLPPILGLVIGITLGKIAFKFRKKWIDKLIQAFFIIGISIPIFFFGLILQYHFAYRWDLLPALGFQGIEYYILPGIALSVLIIALITMQMRSNLETESHEKTVISNTITTAMPFGLIIAFYFIIEIVFNQHGLSELFIRAILDNDFYVIKAILFLIIILFIIITFISNIIFSILKSTSFSTKKSYYIYSIRISFYYLNL